MSLFSQVKMRFAETAAGVAAYGLRNSKGRRVLLAVVWFMFINATIVGMVYISFFIMGIDLLQTTKPNPPTTADFDRLYIVLTCFGNINYILGDAIVVWRAWVLYSQNMTVRASLAFCMIGSFVATIIDVVISIREVPRTHEEREGLGTLGFFLPLLATNLVATSLVAYRVWQHRAWWSELASATRISGASMSEKILVIILESGILFIFYWIIAMLSALRVLGILAHELLECILPQLEGIYLTLVILAVTYQQRVANASTISLDIFSAVDMPVSSTRQEHQMVFAAHGKSSHIQEESSVPTVVPEVKRQQRRRDSSSDGRPSFTDI
ncbi:hypothetical protein D9758_009981 [Tetrapyrgos nigripes]|uniref:Uncharacterized protein n=1 Tax=Tetrapyrgos nigripes TaxID=182062 RepID=A0A8H5CQT6_9AGAR|nr:hypothetical protein D9758_009981 [Tetrapyrgos nigripes]